ncbi:hypothetical protein HMPREF3293_01809 [Christensenella minuta]|uniref:Uncharacterized protein n=1 Tax=Christensenella minuta TaxID=626937 RepID=A0A136Q3F6_9FIRM|nr:hypothetical protein HMPREF3293_01809 [Christensenella minuta]
MTRAVYRRAAGAIKEVLRQWEIPCLKDKIPYLIIRRESFVFLHESKKMSGPRIRLTWSFPPHPPPGSPAAV